jgi:hypothetical protein
MTQIPAALPPTAILTMQKHTHRCQEALFWKKAIWSLPEAVESGWRVRD